MRIRLISGDRFLYRLCREVLLGFRDRSWDFGMVSSHEQARFADLFLWDLQPDMQFPENSELDPERKGIFLVARRHLQAIQRKLPNARFSIILKPVNPALLRTLLEEAVTRFESRQDGRQRAEQLRVERDEILQQFLHANLRLQEYDQDRTNFLARSVHDFRAPLMAVQGYCSLLLDGQLGALNLEQQRILERMQRSVKRLSRLTASMFQMSVGTHTPRRPPRGGGDIQACITQSVHEVGPVLESKGIEIALQVTPPRETLQIDEIQIEQVLVNLLDNASRFTPRGGRIEIRAFPAFWDRRFPNMTEGRELPDRRETASRDQNAYRVEVRDSGPGVAMGDLERIFEEYTSDSSASDRSRAGLGLAICRQIVAAHHGVVFAEPGPQQGATFVFVLPYMEEKSSQSAAEAPAELVSANAGRQ